MTQLEQGIAIHKAMEFCGAGYTPKDALNKCISLMTKQLEAVKAMTLSEFRVWSRAKIYCAYPDHLDGSMMCDPVSVAGQIEGYLPYNAAHKQSLADRVASAKHEYSIAQSRAIKNLKNIPVGKLPCHH